MTRAGLCLIISLALATLVILLTACGQIITYPTPTPVPTPTAGLTASPTVPPTPTPAPLTPLPSATPTITPTPIIYLVESGDNLLSIAAKYGTTAEAIQEANGVLDPRRLLIGQALLIPLDDAAPKDPPTPTALPLSYEIARLNFQLSPSGRLWCLGEVQNTSGENLQQVELAVSLFDKAGELLAFTTGATELDVIPKGGSAPFALAIDNPPEKFDTYQTSPLKGLSATRLGSYYLDLEIVSSQGQARGQASYSVSGRLRNAGDRAARDVRVVVTGYDAAGKVAAVRKVAPALDVLPPGRSTDFEINLLSTAGQVVTYTLQAQGLGETPK
jgi:LysM repeat protein